MPVHVIDDVDDQAFAEVVTKEIATIERRETIIAVTERGGSILVFTQKKTGRPAKETR